MIDALLHAVLANVRRDLGYDHRTMDIRPDGMPPPACGDVFVALHQGSATGDAQNSLDEYYGFALTLTQRVTNVPFDRVGDALLARKLGKETGFNRRAHRLKVYLHMAWPVLQDANQYLVEANPDAPAVYGFCEPARFASADEPSLVGPEWFSAEPGTANVGLRQELRFERARRLQALQTFT